jgi:apolipoprotein N-acyltransferase
MTPGRARLVLPFAAGVIWALCWLPTGLAPFHPLGFLLVMVGLRQLETAGQAARFGLLFGLWRYALMAHYLLVLMKFSPLGLGFYLAPIVYIAPFAVLESWGAFKLERLLGIPRGLAFGILYTLIEYIRSLGDFSLPVDMLAHTFGTSPQWLSLTPWTGAFCISVLIIFW